MYWYINLHIQMCTYIMQLVLLDVSVVLVGRSDVYINLGGNDRSKGHCAVLSIRMQSPAL